MYSNGNKTDTQMDTHFYYYISYIQPTIRLQLKYKGILMNGTVIFGGIILFFIISGLITFVNDLHDEVDVSYGSTRSENNTKYKSINMYGEITLVLTDVDKLKKREVWKNSFLNREMLELFPNFTDMKTLVENRLVDDGLFKEELLQKIVDTEDRYIGGLETGQSARTSLSKF